jgi:hypothetical protein
VCVLLAVIFRYRRKYKTISSEEKKDVASDVKIYHDWKSELHGDSVEKRTFVLHRAPVVELETHFGTNLIGRDSSRDPVEME